MLAALWRVLSENNSAPVDESSACSYLLKASLKLFSEKMAWRSIAAAAVGPAHRVAANSQSEARKIWLGQSEARKIWLGQSEERTDLETGSANQKQGLFCRLSADCNKDDKFA